MIRVVIVDDEKYSIISLEKKLQRFPDIQVVKTYSNHENVLADLRNNKMDAAFLDIEMTAFNGLDLAEEMQAIHSSILIVFVTGHTDYAVKAFEVNSIDYLLKPVTQSRLQKTIDRLREKIQSSKEPAPLPSARQLTIRYFSEFQVWYNREPLHFTTAKVKELFAFLLTHRDTYVHRDIIIDNLWPNQDYKKSKIHLHTCLSHLRKILSQRGYSNCITFSNQGYTLDLEPVESDADEIDRAVQSIEQPGETQLKVLEKAIQIYTGPFMALNGYEWAYEKSQEYHEKMIQILDGAIELCHETQTDKALTYLQFQRKLDPYSDQNIRKTMELLFRQGNRSEAIKLFQEYRALINHELGIEPDDQLIQFYHSCMKESHEGERWQFK